MLKKVKDGWVAQSGDKIIEQWYDDDIRPHRGNGLPAVIRVDNYEGYYTHGDLQYWIWNGKIQEGDAGYDRT